MLLAPEIFFHWKEKRQILDLRPADLFVKGSFEGAVSMPADGYRLVSELNSAIEAMAFRLPVHVIDLDGKWGAGLEAQFGYFAMEGGYKNFKTWREDVFRADPPLAVLGGKTGSGKTELLKEMESLGAQVIDLEEMAGHRGSVFGAIEKPQPLHEHFQLSLLTKWLSFDKDKPVWIEEKGAFMGKVGLPSTLYERIRAALVFEPDTGFEERLQHIVAEYGSVGENEFRACIRKLEGRIGMRMAHKMLHLFSIGNLNKCFELLLHYYDAAYENNRETSRQRGTVFSIHKDQLKDRRVVESLEKLVMDSHKKKDPAAFTAGTNFNVNQHPILSTLRLKV